MYKQNLENILGGDFSDQLKNIIRYKRTGENIRYFIDAKGH